MTRARILDPYTRRTEDTRHRVARVALFGALTLLAMLIGFMTAILPLSLLIVPLAPILVIAAFALWLAPDVGTDVSGPVRKLVLMFYATSMVWPDYIAVTMPGIGWLSPQRLVMGALFFTSLWGLATSSASRQHVLDVIRSNKFVFWVALSFFVLQFIVMFATGTIPSRVIYAQIFWYYMFILSAWAFSQPNTATRLCQILLIGLAVQCFYGMMEFRLQRPMWSGHIPSWLLVDETLLSAIMGQEMRAGTDQYRIGSLYFTSVTFGEAIGLFLPFVMFAIFYAKNTWLRIAAGALLVFAYLNGVWTGSRTAMAVFIVGTVLMTGLWGYKRYQRLKAERDLVSAAVVWSFPVGALLVVLSVFFVRRVRVAVLGGGQHQPSDDARIEQWRRTWALLENNPFGYGPFTAGARVGYTNPGGYLTIDGWAMVLLVDYGVLGFILFTLFFFACIAVGIRTFLNSDNMEEDLAAPLAVALVAFVFVRLVSSQSEVFHLVFGFAGAIMGLHWRQIQRLKAEAAQRPVPAQADPSAPPPRPLVPVGDYGVARAR